MKNITVRHEGYYTVMDEDGDFHCPHDNVEIEPPCCSGGAYIACGCQGMYNVYCPDCHNDDLTDNDIEAILDNYNERDEEDYYD